MNGFECDDDDESAIEADLDSLRLDKAPDFEGLVLETERLFLQRPHRRDLEVIAREIGRAKVARNLAVVPHPYNYIDATSWYGNVKAGWAVHSFSFGIYKKAGRGDLIGVISIEGLLARSNPRPALGYWLAVDQWGRGFMSEAVGAAAQFAFEQLNAPLLEATYLKANRASGRVMEKNGLKRIEKTLLWSRYYLAYLPGYLMRVTKDEWL